MRGVMVAILAGGCSFLPHAAGSNPGSDGSGGGEAGGGDDAPIGIDAMPDAPKQDATPGLDGGDFCMGPPGWAICLAAAPGNDVNLAGNFDTDSDSNCANPTPSSWTDDQDDACVVIGDQIGITGDLHVSGKRPLVLAGATQINMSAGIIIDVASHTTTGQRGAGSPFAQCSAPKTPPVKDTAHGSGGGAGGTFSTAGGTGGFGNNAMNTAGGTPGDADPAPVKLRAGCDGQQGADGSQAAGPAAAGGGALYLVSSTQIRFANTIINASGQGGPIGGHNSGGGGGASGGMVVLWAPTIDTTGLKITANGGGGASGADNNGANRAGADPVASSPATPAAGGGGGAGAVGGNGFAIGANAKPGGNGSANKAGGGGGGGAGYIRANLPLTGNAGLSPAVDVVTP